MIRAFLAVELTEALRTGLAHVQQDLRQRLPRSGPKAVRISWVQPASMHLTIKFLGDTDESAIPPLRDAIAQVMAGHSPIVIPLERLGVFPHLQQPRVLWVGPPEQWERGGDAERLAVLHRTVEESCRSFGFAPEGRPLQAHLTLARIKEGEREVGRGLAQSGILDRPIVMEPLALNAIVLMKSELRPAGPIYTKLWDVGMERRG